MHHDQLDMRELNNCHKVFVGAGPGRVVMAEGKQVTGTESECSVGLHNDSFVEPCNEATGTRQQLLMAISLMKHLAHNSPAAGEALTCAGVMDTIRRYACTSARNISWKVCRKCKLANANFTKSVGADEA